MRYNMYEGGSLIEGSISISGMTVLDYIKLKADPVFKNEAASKQYVDLITSTIRSSVIASGIFNKNRLPSLSGQVVSEQGTGILTLASKDISEGTYTKITVGTNGLVSSVGQLTLEDIPRLGWSKIISGKPTTLEGYGIVNGLSKTDGVVDGVLALKNHPVQLDEVASKFYVDSIVLDHQQFRTGDLITGSYETPPTGFLRCNGGGLSASMYPALSEMLGGVFTYNNLSGSGKPWKQQYRFNEEQTIDIGLWEASTNLPIPISKTQAIVTKNRVYLLGGWDGEGVLGAIYTAPVDNEGIVGEWDISGSLPIPLRLSQAITVKDKVYLLGGDDGISSLSVILTTNINEDGTLGEWGYDTELPIGLSSSQAIVTKNRVYLLGGHTTETTDIIISAPINVDGTLGLWSIEGQLPIPLKDSQVVVTKNRVFLIGGNSEGPSSYVLSSYIESDGTLGEWTISGSLPISLSNTEVIVTTYRLYVIGGLGETGRLSSVYIVPINVDGSLGTWTEGTELPESLINSQAIVLKNKVYLLGGVTGTGVSSVTLSGMFFGGINDYSSYYSSDTEEVGDTGTFFLPDYTSVGDINTNVFVKY